MTTLKVNTEDFGSLALEGEKFFFRCRSFVDIKTGQPLAERRQQKIVVATRDTSLYKSVEKSTALHIKAKERREQIIAWETAAQNGSTVTTGGEVIASSLPLIAPDGDITVAQFFKTVFLPAKQALVDTGQVAAITYSSYERYWNLFLAKHFNGTKTLKNYQSWMGRQFLETLRKKDGTPYGENTVKKIHSIASAIFTEAVDRQYRDHNPWSDIKQAKIPQVSAEQGIAYTEAEVETMIQNLEAELDRNSNPRRSVRIRTARVALALGFWAGLRPSEIIGLKWENADVAHGRLTVCYSVVNRVHAERTKTNEDRIVTYLKPLVPILREWYARNGKPKSGFVLQGQNGGVVDLNHLSDDLIYPICERSGLGERWKGTAFYGLRRGCGSLLVEHGASIEQGAKFLGNTAAVFEKNYWVDKGEMAAQAAEKYSQSKARLIQNDASLFQEDAQQARKQLVELGLGEVVAGRVQ